MRCFKDANGLERRRCVDDEGLHLAECAHEIHCRSERHLALGRRFGTLNVHEFVEAMPGHPEILVVAKYEGDTKNFGGGWHSDVTYLDEPALGSILYALVLTFAASYLPTTSSDCCTQYSIVITFVLIAVVLAFRPRGLFGRLG